MDSLPVQVAVALVILIGLAVLASRLRSAPRLDPAARRQLSSVLRKVLVADDSVTIRKVVELTFSDICEVVEADNGSEALLILETNTEVDLVLADVHMGETSGFEVARRAKQQQPSRPVLVLFGAFEPFDEAGFRVSGADGKVKKPFAGEELVARAAELLLPDEVLRKDT